MTIPGHSLGGDIIFGLSDPYGLSLEVINGMKITQNLSTPCKSLKKYYIVTYIFVYISLNLISKGETCKKNPTHSSRSQGPKNRNF